MFPFIKAAHATKKVKGEDTSIFPGHTQSWSLPIISEVDNDKKSSSSTTKEIAGQDKSIEFTVYAVFDGHGGAESSIFCKDSFINVFVSVVDKLAIDKIKEEQQKQSNQSMNTSITAWEVWTSVLGKAITQTFIDLDNACKSRFTESGTTASVLIVTMENELSYPTNSRRIMITVSNVGDSYICYDSGHNTMIRISDNHRVAGNKSEQERVKNEGGYVGPFPPEEPEIIEEDQEQEIEVSSDPKSKKDKKGSKKDKKGKKSNDQQKKYQQQEEKEKEEKSNASASTANISNSSSNEKKNVDDGSYPLRIWPGGLMMSRTIGDLEALQAIAVPFVSSYFLKVFTSSDKSIGCGGGRVIIASDGLWDEVSFKDASKFTQKKNTEHTASSLSNMASKSAGIYKDDITVIVIDFFGSSSSTSPFVSHAESQSDIERSPRLLKTEMKEDKKATTKAILLNCIKKRKALGPCIRQNRAVLGSTVERIGEDGNQYKVIDIEDDGILLIESDPPTWILEEECNLIIPQKEIEINEAEAIEGTKKTTITDDDLEQLALYLAATDLQHNNEQIDDNQGFQEVSHKKQNSKKSKGNDATKKNNDNNNNDNQKKQSNKPPKQKQRNNKPNKVNINNPNQSQSDEMKTATGEDNGIVASSMESMATSSEEKSDSAPKNDGETSKRDQNQQKPRRYGDRFNRNRREGGNDSAQSQLADNIKGAGNEKQDQIGEQKKRFNNNNNNRRNNQGNSDKRTTTDQNGNQGDTVNQNVSQNNPRFRQRQQRTNNSPNSNNQGQTDAQKDDNGNSNAAPLSSSSTNVEIEQKEKPRQQYQKRYQRKPASQSDNAANSQENPKQEDTSNKDEVKKPNENRPRYRYPKKQNQNNAASPAPTGQTSA